MPEINIFKTKLGLIISQCSQEFPPLSRPLWRQSDDGKVSNKQHTALSLSLTPHPMSPSSVAWAGSQPGCLENLQSAECIRGDGGSTIQYIQDERSMKEVRCYPHVLSMVWWHHDVSCGLSRVWVAAGRPGPGQLHPAPCVSSLHKGWGDEGGGAQPAKTY